MKVVTTYNPKTWEIFARHNIETMVKHIDAEIIVYQEDNQEIDGVIIKNLFDINDIKEVLMTAKGFQPARGMFGNNDNKSYNYNYDIWKFCRKVFSICDAAKSGGDYLIWIDADVEIYRDIDSIFIKRLLNNNALALFQREKMHSECGFVAFDLKHEATPYLLDRFLDLYTSGKIFQIPMGWHDCWALDACINGMKIPVSNLSPVMTDSIDVINNSILSPYLRHDKGNRKFERRIVDV